MLTARINGLYMHDHGKIILFNSKEEIDYFVNGFYNYSLNRAMKEGIDPFSVMSLGQNIVVDEWIEPKFSNCKTIKYEDLKR